MLARPARSRPPSTTTGPQRTGASSCSRRSDRSASSAAASRSAATRASIDAAAADVTGRPAEWIGATAAAAGVTNGYRNPAQLGADRWVAIIGAHSTWAVDCCVVDVGTAMTIDIVTAAGRHEGGLIVPGPTLMIDSLHAQTSDLATRSAASSDPARSAFADQTRDAIKNGCELGAGGPRRARVSFVRPARRIQAPARIHGWRCRARAVVGHAAVGGRARPRCCADWPQSRTSRQLERSEKRAIHGVAQGVGYHPRIAFPGGDRRRTARRNRMFVKGLRRVGAALALTAAVPSSRCRLPVPTYAPGSEIQRGLRGMPRLRRLRGRRLERDARHAAKISQGAITHKKSVKLSEQEIADLAAYMASGGK